MILLLHERWSEKRWATKHSWKANFLKSHHPNFFEKSRATTSFFSFMSDDLKSLEPPLFFTPVWAMIWKATTFCCLKSGLFPLEIGIFFSKRWKSDIFWEKWAMTVRKVRVSDEISANVYRLSVFLCQFGTIEGYFPITLKKLFWHIGR